METDTRQILTEIATVTRDIEDHYPELQKYLDETRSTLPQGNSTNVSLDKKVLQDYLDGLKSLVKSYQSNA